jgi:hypothetical protein
LELFHASCLVCAKNKKNPLIRKILIRGKLGENTRI